MAATFSRGDDLTALFIHLKSRAISLYDTPSYVLLRDALEITTHNQQVL